jgi:hypothetical protein
MMRIFRRKPTRGGFRHPNCFAVVIAAATAVVMHLNFDPAPAGAESIADDYSFAHITAAVAPLPAEYPSADSDAENLHGQTASSPADFGTLSGQRAMLMHVLLLERGLQKLSQTPDYTATFAKQERLDGDLGDTQAMQMKVRHEPFSVYMKWLQGDTGRELLYVDGEHEGKMLVKVGGFKGKMLPALKVDPAGSLALKEARYPVTKAGLKNLALELIHHRQRDLKHIDRVGCRMLADQQFDGRKCYCFLVEYRERAVSDLYRKSLIYIDSQLSLPVMVRNHTWPTEEQQQLTGEKLDEATLIESYAYSNIQLDQRLADAEFDRENDKYRFCRR